jgi:hypothetical protein
MALIDFISFGGRRQWVALGVLAAAFATMIAFDLNAWVFIAFSMLFVGYICRSFSGSFISERDYSRERIMSYVFLVGIAVVQTLVCLGSVWLIAWPLGHLFGH